MKQQDENVWTQRFKVLYYAELGQVPLPDCYWDTAKERLRFFLFLRPTFELTVVNAVGWIAFGSSNVILQAVLTKLFDLSRGISVAAFTTHKKLGIFRWNLWKVHAKVILYQESRAFKWKQAMVISSTVTETKVNIRSGEDCWNTKFSFNQSI